MAACSFSSCSTVNTRFGCSIIAGTDSGGKDVSLAGTSGISRSGFSLSLIHILPGLADTGVSLISVDQPGYYLRHYEGQIILSKDDGSDLFKQDATWIQHRALDGSNGVSFESVNFPGQYIRHYDSYLRISPISTTIEKGDASFVITMQ